MEEYRDLALTVAAFRAVLDEPEFRALDAGIVLQAYLPDSHAALDELCDWAARRAGGRGRRGQGPHRQGRQPGDGAGRRRAARLAAGAVRDEGRGRRQLQAPARPRCSTRRCGDGVRVGVASHNLFDVAWALGVPPRRGRASTASRSRCSRAWRRRAGRGGRASRRRACCSTRRSCDDDDFAVRASPTSCAASTRTPRPENFLRVARSTSRPARRAFGRAASPVPRRGGGTARVVDRSPRRHAGPRGRAPPFDPDGAVRQRARHRLHARRATGLDRAPPRDRRPPAVVPTRSPVRRPRHDRRGRQVDPARLHRRYRDALADRASSSGPSPSPVGPGAWAGDSPSAARSLVRGSPR